MKPFIIFTIPLADSGRFIHDSARVFDFAPGTYEGRPAMIAEIDEATIANGHGGRLILEHEGHKPISQRGRLRTAGTFDERVEFLADDFTFEALPFESHRMPRLVRRGLFFALESGERHTVIGNSQFNLYHRWYDEGPEAVAAVCEQLAAIGFNEVRVWTNMLLAWAGIGDFRPETHPAMYERIGAFCQFLSHWRLYVEFTAYTGEPGRNDLAHYRRLAEALARPEITNARVEGINENDTHQNGIDPARITPVAGLLVARGSNGAGAWPVDPPLDYETFHTNGMSEWHRKTGHNAMEIADARGRPVVTNENTRYPDREQSLEHAEDAAAAAALLCAGAVYHDGYGKSSTPKEGIALEGARAWVRGARSVPLEFQDGRYIRRDDLLAPGLIRVYERRLSDGRGHIVRIRA